jgi:hypothetical protein
MNRKEPFSSSTPGDTSLKDESSFATGSPERSMVD